MESPAMAHAAPVETFDAAEDVDTAPVAIRTAPAVSMVPPPAIEDAPRPSSRDIHPAASGAADMVASELAETSKRLTENLLRAMGFEAKVSVTAEGNRADVTVEVSQDDELLTGQKGEVRQAMQHLLNRFLNRGEGSRYHLQLEINDFWQRRENELAAMARTMADEALASNTEVVTEYLNSQERRIVHVTLKEDTRVKTYALGTGMIKRVAVAPADFPERTGEDDAG
jgi:spoIIIJ-associated protein